MLGFLIEYSRRFVLKVKIMRYFIRVESIQKKMKEYYDNVKCRFIIVEEIVRLEIQNW